MKLTSSLSRRFVVVIVWLQQQRIPYPSLYPQEMLATIYQKKKQNSLHVL